MGKRGKSNHISTPNTERRQWWQIGKPEIAAEDLNMLGWFKSAFLSKGAWVKTPRSIIKGTEHRARTAAFSKEPQSAKGMFICSATKDKGQTTDLYLIDGRGKTLVQLTRSNPQENLRYGTDDFAVSPDGLWVAYTCYVERSANVGKLPVIRSVPASGGKARELTPIQTRGRECYMTPVFSGSGDLLICRHSVNGLPNLDLEVRSLHAFEDGLLSAPILSIVNPMRIGIDGPIMTPDGQHVIYFQNFAYEDQLEVCWYDRSMPCTEARGEVGRRLTDNADGVFNRRRAIAYSARSEQIFFVQGHTSSHNRICTIFLPDLPEGARLSEFGTIGGDHRSIGELAIAPDGRSLAYAADHSIFVVGTDGSRARRISKEGANCRCPWYSEDGSRVAYLADGKLALSEVNSSATETFASHDMELTAVLWA